MSCWFSHDRIRERDTEGRLVLTCQTCGDTVPVLASEMITDGPAHQAQAVMGQPELKVTHWRIERQRRA